MYYHRLFLISVLLVACAKNMSGGLRSQGCLNDPDHFCYICGEYILKENRKNIIKSVLENYSAYFGIPIENLDKTWVPHKVCRTCEEHLRQWSNKKRKSLKFGKPMIWREPTSHYDDCYFCSINVKGINKKSRRNLTYPELRSASRPVPHSNEVPIPSVPSHMSTESSLDASSSSQKYSDPGLFANIEPTVFETQGELNDLVRDLNLSKDQSELLASRLNEKNLLGEEVNISFYRNRHIEFLKFFDNDDNLVFCIDVQGLLQFLGIESYDPSDWRLFIDSCKRSLKCVLLHNGNQYGSVPLAHSTTMKEKYEEIKHVMEKIQYNIHNWQICVDFKMVNFLLGQQSGYTKYPCFICLWDSRDKKITM